MKPDSIETQRNEHLKWSAEKHYWETTPLVDKLQIGKHFFVFLRCPRKIKDGMSFTQALYLQNVASTEVRTKCKLDWRDALIEDNISG